MTFHRTVRRLRETCLKPETAAHQLYARDRLAALRISLYCAELYRRYEHSRLGPLNRRGRLRWQALYGAVMWFHHH